MAKIIPTKWAIDLETTPTNQYIKENKTKPW